ncbi:MAG: SPFH domain-containing protein [Phycisphaerales bacterium]
MSDLDPRDPGSEGATRRTGRASSVTLREGAESARAEVSERMDPANQSLADALRITYRLVQASMVVLLILFLASGFRTVGEGQRGVRLLFGKIQQSNLSPGAQWAWPYPLGELLKVDIGTTRVAVNRAFFPWVERGDEDRAIDRLPSAGTLNPARDGSLLTADLNLAHAQWSVSYRRVSLGEYIENVRPGDGLEAEQRLVRLIVQRAIVLATAEVTIDELLKTTQTDTVSVEAAARDTAQRMLNDLGTGIEIDQLTLTRRPFPPVTLYDKFNQVSNQAQNVGEAREKAAQQRAQLLNAVAGAAAEPLINQIDEYERATELNDEGAQREILTQIDALLEGRPVEIDGRTYEGLASGEVAEILNDAANQRSAIVNRARADAAVFAAKLEQFRTSPSLMMARDWGSAYMAFRDKPFVQAFQFPKGYVLDLKLNADPDIARLLDKAAKELELKRTQEQRMKDLEKARFKTDEGIITPEDL